MRRQRRKTKCPGRRWRPLRRLAPRPQRQPVRSLPRWLRAPQPPSPHLSARFGLAPAAAEDATAADEPSASCRLPTTASVEVVARTMRGEEQEEEAATPALEDGLLGSMELGALWTSQRRAEPLPTVILSPSLRPFHCLGGRRSPLRYVPLVEPLSSTPHRVPSLPPGRKIICTREARLSVTKREMQPSCWEGLRQTAIGAPERSMMRCARWFSSSDASAVNAMLKCAIVASVPRPGVVPSPRHGRQWACRSRAFSTDALCMQYYYRTVQ